MIVEIYGVESVKITNNNPKLAKSIQELIEPLLKTLKLSI